MMAVGLLILRTEARHYHIGAEIPDHPHHIGKNFIVTPNVQCFVSRFRKPEIDRSREELAGMVDATRIEQFLCSNNAESLTQFRADNILAAVATRDRKISGIVK